MSIPRPRSHPPAFALVDLLVILALAVVLAALAAVFLVRTRQAVRTGSTPNQRIHCVSNLKQIGLAFRMFSVDHGDRFPMGVAVAEGGSKEYVETGPTWRHFQVLSNELSTPKILVCPADPARQSAPHFAAFGPPNLSYFVGLDADETRPPMLLAGDDNLETPRPRSGAGHLNLRAGDPVRWKTGPPPAERHGQSGNVALADGSVQQFSDARLQAALRESGIETNRLAMP